MDSLALTNALLIALTVLVFLAGAGTWRHR